MTDHRFRDALTLGREIDAGRLDPRSLAREFLAAADGGGAERTGYVRMMADRALAEADAAAERARHGVRRSVLDGVPISWKDNFDTAGVPTEAGSRLLAGRTPDTDATVLARATRAGLIALGKTAMTELAYSGLGYNPQAGTPFNPFDATTPRLPGGSSAGAAVGVARGQAAAGIGTDTGGSVRIPAAWNGLVGFKTSPGLLPLTGVVPLAPSFDTVGPLTRTVGDAAALVGVLSADTGVDLTGAADAKLTLLAVTGPALDVVGDAVRARYDAALDTLARRGARIEARAVETLPKVWALGALDLAAEAHALWGAQIAASPGTVYERVSERVLAGAATTASEAGRIRAGLRALRDAYAAETDGFDAVLLPTVTHPAPAIAEIEASPEAYRAINGRALSLTSLGNRLGLCAVTLPLEPVGAPPMPVGLMAMAPAGADRRLLRIAAALEAQLGR